MRSRHSTAPRSLALLITLCLVAAAAAAAPGTRTITFQDLMKFRAIQAPVLSDDGTVVATRSSPIAGTARAWCTCSPAARSTACRVAARP